MADFDDIDDFNDHAVQGKPIRAYKNGHFDNPKVLFVQHHWTWDEFLCAASQRLEMVPTASRVFNADGAEIDDIMCIEENDMLFFSTGRSFKAPSAGKEEAASAGSSADDKIAAVVGGYKVTTLLGRGGFGEVRLGVHQLTNDRVALKFILKSEMGSLGDVERTTTEIQCLTALNHPSIIKLLRVVNESNHIVLIFELLEGGDLFHYLKNVPDGGLSEEEGAAVFTQILAGVGYAHNQHICHRDLKLENILLTHKNDLSTVKIADFGLSDFYKPGAMMKTSCGSISYLAPEVFRGTSNAGPPLDVWSLGVILFAVMCGRLPFEGSDLHGTNRPRENVIRNRIMRGQYKLDEHFSPALADLITQMLKPDPNERATIPEIFSHPWVRGAAGPSGLLSDLMMLNSRSGTQDGGGDAGDDDLDFAITYTPARSSGGGAVGGGILPLPAFLPVQANDDDKLPSILQRSPSRMDTVGGNPNAAAGVAVATGGGGSQSAGTPGGTPTTGRTRGGRIVDNLLQPKTIAAAPKLSPRPSVGPGTSQSSMSMTSALVPAGGIGKGGSGGSLSPNTSNFKRNTSSTGASRSRTRPSAVSGFGGANGNGGGGVSADKSHAERAPAHASDGSDKLPLAHQKNTRRRSDQQGEDGNADPHHLAGTTAAATAVFHPSSKISPGGAGQAPHVLESIGRKANSHQQELTPS